MTREQMEDIIEFYLRGADSKSIMECTDIDVDRYNIEEFLRHAAAFVGGGIIQGVFDHQMSTAG